MPTQDDVLSNLNIDLKWVWLPWAQGCVQFKIYDSISLWRLFSFQSCGGIFWVLAFTLSVCLQDGKVLFPAPPPNNIPVAAPTKHKSVQELEKERAAAISPFRATLTTAGLYSGGKSQSGLPSRPPSSHRISAGPPGLIWKRLPMHFKRRRHWWSLTLNYVNKAVVNV